ncbi:hypothetical protein HFO89_08660 [Rhizobium leguminosarum]|uniref:hypothetical protein n=1 Tax=Rhizobium leguminosarum TaxID=384 RepID=UPI001C952623|nr:hypothetical protein [Rhizobium leguminosarum]MBY5456427.1 hypothetical protein [Rhizobium leguminosarum]
MGAELLSDDVESTFDIIEGALPHDYFGMGIYVPYPTTPTGRRYLLNPCDNPKQVAVANLRLVFVGTFPFHEAILPHYASGTVTHFSLCNKHRLSIETLADHGNVSPALDRADRLKRQLKRMRRDRLAPPLFPRFGAVAWMRFKHVGVLFVLVSAPFCEPIRPAIKEFVVLKAFRHAKSSLSALLSPTGGVGS